MRSTWRSTSSPVSPPRGGFGSVNLISVVDVRQSWMADGARSLTDWVAARLRVRHSTAVQLVAVARRLSDLPVLGERFASGVLSLDQVDAISRIATADTEDAVIAETAGLSNHVLDRPGPPPAWCLTR
jgi:hypothetical protein